MILRSVGVQRFITPSVVKCPHDFSPRLRPMEVNSLVQRDEPFAATEAIFSLQCYTLASISILYYDHIATLPQEVQKIWKRDFSVVNALFLVNRYGMSLGYIPIVYFIFSSPKNPTICSNYIRYPAVLSIVTQAIISVVAALRCYALYNRSRWVLGFVSLLSLAVLCSFVWATTTFVGIDESFGGIYETCVPSLEPKENTPYKLAWSLSVIFDSMIFALTIFKTLQMRRTYKFQGTYGSLTNLFMRDGSIYFAVMAIAYVVHIVLFFHIENSFFTDSTGNNAFLTHTISVTMLSRLILNLNSFPDRHARQQSEALNVPV